MDVAGQGSSLSFKGKPAFQQEVALERVIYDTSCLESASGGSVKRRGMKAVEGVSAFHAESAIAGHRRFGCRQADKVECRENVSFLLKWNFSKEMYLLPIDCCYLVLRGRIRTPDRSQRKPNGGRHFSFPKGSLSGGRIVSIGLNSCKLFQIITQLEIQSEMLAEHILIADTQVAHPSGVNVDRFEQTVSCIGGKHKQPECGKADGSGRRHRPGTY